MPRAALSASARAGRRKKIAVSHEVLGIFFVPYVPRYSQFSCGFRRASEGVPPSDTAPLARFMMGASPPSPPFLEKRNPPTNPNLIIPRIVYRGLREPRP